MRLSINHLADILSMEDRSIVGLLCCKYLINLKLKQNIMGASNFYNKNASRIFACELEDEWSFDDHVANLQTELEQNHGFDRIGGDDGDRSYPMNYIAEKRVSFSYKDFWVSATIKAGIRSAYYDGCNLDWEVEYDWESLGYCEDGITPDFFQPRLIKGDLMYYFGLSEGNASRYALWASKRLERLGQGLINELEAVYAKYCGMELKRVATFSNGESIYEQVS